MRVKSDEGEAHLCGATGELMNRLGQDIPPRTPALLTDSLSFVLYTEGEESDGRRSEMGGGGVCGGGEGGSSRTDQQLSLHYSS